MPRAKPRGVLYAPMLICADFRASFDFYGKKLGLATETDGSPPWAEFQSNGVRLVLLDKRFWGTVNGARAPPLGAKAGGNLVLSIQVDDVDRVGARLEKAGVPIEVAPADRPMMGLRSLLTRDPDGNVVEVSTKLRATPT